jgi:hypothetical protein
MSHRIHGKYSRINSQFLFCISYSPAVDPRHPWLNLYLPFTLLIQIPTFNPSIP